MIIEYASPLFYIVIYIFVYRLVWCTSKYKQTNKLCQMSKLYTLLTFFMFHFASLAIDNTSKAVEGCWSRSFFNLQLSTFLINEKGWRARGCKAFLTFDLALKGLAEDIVLDVIKCAWKAGRCLSAKQCDGLSLNILTIVLFQSKIIGNSEKSEEIFTLAAKTATQRTLLPTEKKILSLIGLIHKSPAYALLQEKILDKMMKNSISLDIIHLGFYYAKLAPEVLLKYSEYAWWVKRVITMGEEARKSGSRVHDKAIQSILELDKEIISDYYLENRSEEAIQKLRLYSSIKVVWSVNWLECGAGEQKEMFRVIVEDGVSADEIIRRLKYMKYENPSEPKINQKIVLSLLALHEALSDADIQGTLPPSSSDWRLTLEDQVKIFKGLSV